MSNDADEGPLGFDRVRSVTDNVQIRRKRLQKLGGSSSSSSVASGAENKAVAGASPTVNSQPTIPSPVIKAQTASTSSPATSIESSPAGSSTPSVSVPASIPHSTPATTPAAATPAVTTRPQMSWKEWQNKTIQDVLQVSLTPRSDYCVLQSVADELSSENAELVFTKELLDQVFWSRLTEQKCLPSVFDYLLGCWTRAASSRRLLKPKHGVNPPDYEEKLSLLNEIQNFSVNFAVISGTADADEGTGLYSNIGERLLSKASSNRSPLPWEFIDAVIARAEEQELTTVLLGGVFSQLTKLGAKIFPPDLTTTLIDYRPYFTVLENLTSIKLVASSLPLLDNFEISEKTVVPPPPTPPSNPPVPSVHPTEASQIITNTILGPFFATSPIDPPFCWGNFTNPEIMSQPEIDRVAIDIRAELKVVQERLFFICDKIVRASPASRQALLEYFGKILDLNHRRTAMQVDPKTVSPDGFMLNITYVLTKFSEPFADLYGTKLDKISKDYYSHDPVLDISEETKIASDIQASNEYYKVSASTTNVNFISHCFFLTLGYFHYGLGGTIQSSSRLKNIIEDLKHHIARIEAELPRFENTPRINFIKNALDNARLQLRQAQGLRISSQCVLYDMDQQSVYLEMAAFQLMFLIHVASLSQYPPASNLALPFQNNIGPDIFINYPEYLIEAPISLALYISRYLPHILVKNSHTHVPLVNFCVTFLSNTGYIKNPYLKAKLVELLFYGSIDYQNGQKGYFVNIFDSDPLCHKHLLHSLMNFYIEVEQTGASSQFYDKFNTRYYISQIIKCIWANSIYRANLAKESEQDVDFFVHFVALLLNDATYLLDESLAKLGEIHKLQKELPAVASPEEDQETTEKRGQLEQAEKHATSYMQLTNQTVVLLNLFTSAIPKAFVTPEIVDRFAAMLNYNLTALVGPKCRELKVQNPEKYGFNPRELLSRIVDVYLNLQKEEPFIKAVARDGRSYNPANFDRAVSVLGRWVLKSPAELQTLSQLREAAELVKQEDEQGELELGDIPDEFLDPLMYTLMEEPVILPSSKVTIDLGTIKSHLLSDAKDPFNRAPLTIEQVIPNTELKEKIQAFKREQREKYLAARSNMDTSS
ncbi:ubiquitin-ubiquitin ligase UFD2 [Sugiyamaella lignohabitans]|uniref:RING-type E3 ubiquitin transferase n=1 Tax=Sugiyamaella lignohabitans TaxID=796027 RepID=A0A167DBZ2_9ASCO|nr:ubiquitin-ubiquitin ligase UFD2 [Sugiyamaella lignohabitans]ANB12739.1 ubiquitin-ubiquitin ligase UFD2 [Sugiyamaella lignohabitans]